MFDLYRIPQDNLVDYRLKKFVEYRHEAFPVINTYLPEWCIKHDFGADRTVTTCWQGALCYNEITAIFLDRLEVEEGRTYEQVWAEFRERLNFGSAKKYVKNNNQYVDVMKEWDLLTSGNPYRWLKSNESKDPEQTYFNIHKSMEHMKHVGRFTVDIFLYCVFYLREYFDICIKLPLNLDWVHCANLTSAVFNIFYEDVKANDFDRTKKISGDDYKFLMEKLDIIQNEIKKTYPDEDLDDIGKLCSFRNLFKGARYGGFHHDRQLEVIKWYEVNFPQYKDLTNDMYALRKEIFQNRYLGEIHGWGGIRKPMKKLWLKTGYTGAEPHLVFNGRKWV